MWERELQPEKTPARSPASEAVSEQQHPLIRMQQLAGNRATTEGLSRSGLRVSKPTDTTERAADDRAGAAVAGTGDGGFDPGPEFASGLAASAQTPVSQQLRRELSRRVGADLSSLTLHTDDTAARLAESVDASALTHRNHVYLGVHVRDLSSPESKDVLAHEAAHVAAHSNGSSDGNTVHRAKLPEWLRKLSRAMPRFGRKKDAAPSYPPLQIDAPTWEEGDIPRYKKQRKMLGLERGRRSRAQAEASAKLAKRADNSRHGQLRNGDSASLPTKALFSPYVGEEDKVAWRARDEGEVNDPNAFTFYAKTPEQQRHFKAQTSAPWGPHEQNVQEPAMNVSDATGKTLNGQRGFVVNAQGELSTFKEGTAGLGKVGEDNPASAHHNREKIDENDIIMQNVMSARDSGDVAAAVHHSSPLGGAGVAGAGLADFDKGFMTQLRDESGHYRPEAEYTYNSTDALRKQGIVGQRVNDSGDLESTRIQLMGAKGTSGREGKGWVRKDESLYQGDIALPYQAFLTTHGNEFQMRKKAAMHEQLTGIKKNLGEIVTSDEDHYGVNVPSQVNASASSAGTNASPEPHTYLTSDKAGSNDGSNSNESGQKVYAVSPHEEDLIN